MKKTSISISILVLIAIVSSLFLNILVHYPNNKSEIKNERFLTLNEDWLQLNPTSGIVDLNKPDKEFDIISIGDLSNNWIRKSTVDSDDKTNQMSVFSSWMIDNVDTEILVASNVYSNFTQGITYNLQDYDIFSVNSSLLAPILLINTNINESIKVSFNFQHFGFRLLYEEDNQIFNAITLIPDLIKEKIITELLPGLKDPEILFTVSEDRLRITYKNLLIFWQSNPQELNIDLIVDSFPSILPFSYGLSTNFITVFDSITYDYSLSNKKGNTANIINKVEIGPLSRLIINETLPDFEDWPNSNQIFPNPIDLNLHPLLPANIQIDFPTLSVYTGEDIGKRLQLEGKKLKLQALDSIADFMFDENENFELNRFQDSSIYNSEELQQTLTHGITYQLEKVTNDNPMTVNILTYDKKNYDLGIQDQQLFMPSSSSLNPDLISSNYKTVYSKFLELYKKFLTNYSLSKNVYIPDTLFDAIQDTIIIQTELNIWDGSPIEYYHGFKISTENIQDSISTTIETANYYLFDFPILFLILAFTFKKARKRKKN